MAESFFTTETDSKGKILTPGTVAHVKEIAQSSGVPIFQTLAEAQAWEKANPGKIALTIENVTPDTTPPSSAGTLSVTVSDTNAIGKVSGAVDDRGITSYSFRTGTNAWSSWQSSSEYTFTGLTTSTPYNFQHRVADAAGNMVVGSAVAKTTLDKLPVTDDYTYQWLGSQAGGSTWIDTKSGKSAALSGSGAVVEGKWLQTRRVNSGSTATYGPVTFSEITSPTPTLVVVMRTKNDWADRMGVALGTFGNGSIGIMSKDGTKKTPGLLINGSQVNTGVIPYTDDAIGIAIARFASGSSSIVWNGGTPAVSAEPINITSISTAPMHIAYAGGNTNFSGDIGEVRVYNRRLSDAEVDKLTVELKETYGIA